MTVTEFELRLTSARDLRGVQLELGMLARGFDPDAVQLHDLPELVAEAVGVERWATTIKTLAARRMEDAGDVEAGSKWLGARPRVMARAGPRRHRGSWG